MKILKIFLKTAIPFMLIFTILIGSAVSYQQSMTETSENVFAFGDIDLTLNVPELANRKDTAIYPAEYIQAAPRIQNTGKSSAWIILAVKIPSINSPFNVLGSGENNVYNEDGSSFYPAFSTVDYSSINRINYTKNETNLSQTAKDWVNNPADTLDVNNLNPNWTKLDVIDDYADLDGEGGFYIYYFGYNYMLNPTKTAIVPFTGFISSNFQKVSYSQNNKEIKETFIEELEQNLGIEIKLLAIQSGTDFPTDDIYGAWEYYQNDIGGIKLKSNNSMFGTKSVVDIRTQRIYTAEEAANLNIKAIVTKDVRTIESLKAVNITTGEETEITAKDWDISSYRSEEDGFRGLSLNFSIKESGNYVIYAKYVKETDWVKYANLGYIEIK